MKRITKTDIYAKHGIEFKKEGNKELIYCKPIDKWINKLIPVGTNTKIGKKAGTWSMTHGNETVNIIDMHVKMQEIMKLGASCIEQETASFGKCMKIIEKDGFPILVISDSLYFSGKLLIYIFWLSLELIILSFFF